jgi:hypothetical protein
MQSTLNWLASAARAP